MSTQVTALSRPGTQAAARAALMDTPPAICIFGDAKLGKTSDAIKALPRALCIGPKGAFIPASTVVGWVPEIYEVVNLIEALAICRANMKRGSRHFGLILDDMSQLARNTKDHFERTGLKNFELWGQLEAVINNLIRYAREDTGVPVIMTAHAIAPEYSKGKPPVLLRRGCPKMPMESLSTGLPGMVDTVTRLEYDQLRAGRTPHPVSYKAGLLSGHDWITGDRYNIIGSRAPHNLGEIMRTHGIKLPRAPGMDWVEDWVEGAAQQIIAAGGGFGAEKQVLEGPVRHLQQQGCPPQQIIWFLSDARDRAELRGAIAAPLAAYGF